MSIPPAPPPPKPPATPYPPQPPLSSMIPLVTYLNMTSSVFQSNASVYSFTVSFRASVDGFMDGAGSVISVQVTNLNAAPGGHKRMLQQANATANTNVSVLFAVAFPVGTPRASMYSLLLT